MSYLQSEGFLYNNYLAVGFNHVPLIFFGDMSLQWFLRGADTLPRMHSIVNSLVLTFINFQKLGHKNKMLLHPQLAASRFSTVNHSEHCSTHT